MQYLKRTILKRWKLVLILVVVVSVPGYYYLNYRSAKDGLEIKPKELLLSNVFERYKQVVVAVTNEDSNNYLHTINALDREIKNVRIFNLKTPSRHIWLTCSERVLENLSRYKSEDPDHRLLNAILPDMDSILVMGGLLPNNNLRGKMTLEILKTPELLDSEKAIATAYFNLGFFNHHVSRNKIARVFFLKALKGTHTLKDFNFRKKVLLNLGSTLYSLNKYADAYKCFDNLITLSKSTDDKKMIASAKLEQSILESGRGFHKTAEIFAINGAEYFQKTFDTLNIAQSYLTLAIIKTKSQQFKTAETFGIKALAYYQHTNAQSGLAKTYAQLGRIYTALNQFEDSDYALNQGLQAADSDHLYGTSNWISLQLIDNMVARNNLANVPGLLEAAFTKLKAVESDSNLFEIYFNIESVYFSKTGNYSKFKESAAKRRKYFDEIVAKQHSYSNLQLPGLNGNSDFTLSDWSYKTTIAVMLLVISGSLVIYISHSILKHNRLSGKKETDEIVITEESNDEQIFSVGEKEYGKQEELFLKIVYCIEHDQLHLNPNLNISFLCTLLKTNEKYISFAINSYAKVNFNTFINGYRIAHSKNLILSNNENLSLKEISFRSGFNNHTTFYRQFKEISGQSPSKFK